MTDLKRDFVSEKIDYVIGQLENGIEQSARMQEKLGMPNIPQYTTAQKMLMKIARMALRKEILGENPGGVLG